LLPRCGDRVARRDGPHSSSTDPQGQARKNALGLGGAPDSFWGIWFMRTVALLTSAFGCLLAALFVSPAVAAAGPARLDQREKAIVRGINEQRARYGVAPVRASRRLARAADYHSWEMLDGNYFAHTSRDGGAFDARIHRYTHKQALGEALAMLGGACGRGSARRIVNMWMNSPPHRAILLSGRYRRIGLAKRTGTLGSMQACVVTADFASKH
jgi:uncharacterized protein YkwD